MTTSIYLAKTGKTKTNDRNGKDLRNYDFTFIFPIQILSIDGFCVSHVLFVKAKSILMLMVFFTSIMVLLRVFLHQNRNCENTQDIISVSNS